MKLCAVCSRTAADDVAVCPSCGEASWYQGAKDEPPVIEPIEPEAPAPSPVEPFRRSRRGR
jgi:hypothetical protein